METCSFHYANIWVAVTVCLHSLLVSYDIFSVVVAAPDSLILPGLSLPLYFIFHPSKGKDWIYLILFGACIGLFFSCKCHIEKVKNTLYCLFNRTIKYLTMAWGQMVMTQHVEIQADDALSVEINYFNTWWALLVFELEWEYIYVYIYICVYIKNWWMNEWVRGSIGQYALNPIVTGVTI